MIIQPHELESALWKKLQAHYESRLDTLRKRNDGDLDHEGTVKLRGRIAEVRAFLALGMKDEDKGISGAE